MVSGPCLNELLEEGAELAHTVEWRSAEFVLSCLFSWISGCGFVFLRRGSYPMVSSPCAQVEKGTSQVYMSMRMLVCQWQLT